SAIFLIKQTTAYAIETCLEFSVCSSDLNPTPFGVRNVALFGLPINGPVIESTSPMDRPAFNISFTVICKPYVPILLPTKFGVSFASNTTLPNLSSQNSFIIQRITLSVILVEYSFYY